MEKMLILLVVCQASALDQHWIESVAEQNCSSILHIPLSSYSPGRKYNSHLTSTSAHCPPWYYFSSNHCVFGDHLEGIMREDTHTMQASVQHLYCLTTSSYSNMNITVVGGCLFSLEYFRSFYLPLPCNISKLNDYTCADLNREGQLCGRCQDGFAPPVYSYSIRCVNCTDYRFGWVKYMVIAFVPLTAFFLFIVTCHISPTSPYLHGPILFSHVFSLPMLSRIFALSYDTHTKTFRSIVLAFLSLMGL